MESTKSYFWGIILAIWHLALGAGRAVPMSWQPQYYVVVNQRTYQSKGVFTELRYSELVLTKKGILKSEM